LSYRNQPAVLARASTQSTLAATRNENQVRIRLTATDTIIQADREALIFLMNRKPESTGKRINRIGRFELVGIVLNRCGLIVHVGGGFSYTRQLFELFFNSLSSRRASDHAFDKKGNRARGSHGSRVWLGGWFG
jgi:hypothetical protein